MRKNISQNTDPTNPAIKPADIPTLVEAHIEKHFYIGEDSPGRFPEEKWD